MRDSFSTGRSPDAPGGLALPCEWNPRAVVFDMDGLLLNTEKLARRALMIAGHEVGLDISETVCEAMIGVPADGCHRLLVTQYGEQVAADAFFAATTRHLHAQIDAGHIECLPGARALVDYLRRHDIPRAVATSSSREKAHHHLQAAGLLHGFDIVVTRDDVARGKPFPDLYLHAASRLGFAPGECLALEDSYNGVRAANAAGVPVVMVPDLLRPTDEMYELCLAVLPDLCDVLRRLDGAASAASAISAG